MVNGREMLNRNADLSLLVGRHFEKLRSSAVPVSIRRQVKALRHKISVDSISDEDLIREVERCAIERGFPVYFDAHVPYSDRVGSR
jgi:hypothetical protein